MEPRLDEPPPLKRQMDPDGKVLYWEVFVSPDEKGRWAIENRVQWIKNKDPSSERYAVRVARDRAESDPDKVVSIKATRSDGYVWEKWRHYPDEVD